MPDEPTENRTARGVDARGFWTRRVVAIVIDWLCSYAISIGFFQGHPAVTLGIFALSTVVLQATLGTTMGHRIVGVGVRTQAGTPPGLRRALIRTLGLCLVLPAVIIDRDGRGMHERWSGTHVVRLTTPTAQP